MTSDNEGRNSTTGNNARSTPHTIPNIPSDILDDLCSRFIINIPREEREDLTRICFQIELAHWFYIDFFCEEMPQQCPTCNIKSFAKAVFKHCHFLSIHTARFDQVFDDWRTYKMSVPTFGAIMLDDTLEYVLLAQGFWAKSTWGFPKGKVNEGELEHDCAIREVLEETGFDITLMMDRNRFLETRVNEQTVRLYIIPGVSRSTVFKPKTRNEIKCLEWFKVDDLPMHKRDQTPKVALGLSPNMFFMVVNFVKPLKKWIHKETNRPASCGVDTVTNKQRSRTAGSDHGNWPVSDKQKDKMQKYFELQTRMDSQESRGSMDSISTKKRSTSMSPIPRFQKLREKQATEREQRRQQSKEARNLQILNRDGTVSGGSGVTSAEKYTRRSLATQFNDTGSQDKKTQRKKKAENEAFSSESWLNFHFDRRQIMSAFNNTQRR